MTEIPARLRYSLWILVTMIGLLAAYAVFSLHALRAAYSDDESAVVEYSQRMIALLQLQVATERKIGSLRGYLLTGNPIHAGRFDVAENEVERRLAELTAAISTEQGKRLLDTVRHKDRTYTTRARTALDMKTDNAPQERIISLAETSLLTARQELDAAMRSFVGFEEELLSRTRSDAARSRKENDIRLTVWAIVAMVVVAALALGIHSAFRLNRAS